MTELIFVKDYPCKGMNSCATFYQQSTGTLWMRDGDIHTLKELKKRGCKLIPVPYNALIQMLEKKYGK